MFVGENRTFNLGANLVNCERLTDSLRIEDEKLGHPTMELLGCCASRNRSFKRRFCPALQRSPPRFTWKNSPLALGR